MITVGGFLANSSRRVCPPRTVTSSSLTILTTCWAGFSAPLTSAPSARSRTAVGELADHRQGDVGVEQGPADLLHRRGDVLLGQPALATQVLEGRVQAVGERGEHDPQPTERSRRGAPSRSGRRRPRAAHRGRPRPAVVTAAPRPVRPGRACRPPGRRAWRRGPSGRRRPGRPEPGPARAAGPGRSGARTSATVDRSEAPVTSTARAAPASWAAALRRVCGRPRAARSRRTSRSSTLRSPADSRWRPSSSVAAAGGSPYGESTHQVSTARPSTVRTSAERTVRVWLASSPAVSANRPGRSGATTVTACRPSNGCTLTCGPAPDRTAAARPSSSGVSGAGPGARPSARANRARSVRSSTRRAAPGRPGRAARGAGVGLGQGAEQLEQVAPRVHRGEQVLDRARVVRVTAGGQVDQRQVLAHQRLDVLDVGRRQADPLGERPRDRRARTRSGPASTAACRCRAAGPPPAAGPAARRRAGTARPPPRPGSGAGRRCAGGPRCAAGGTAPRPTPGASSPPGRPGRRPPRPRPGSARSASRSSSASRAAAGHGTGSGGQCSARFCTVIGESGMPVPRGRRGGAQRQHRVVRRMHARARARPRRRARPARDPAAAAAVAGARAGAAGSARPGGPAVRSCRRRTPRSAPRRETRVSRSSASPSRTSAATASCSARSSFSPGRPVTVCRASRTSSRRSVRRLDRLVRPVGQPGGRDRTQHRHVAQPAAALLQVRLEQVRRVAVPLRALGQHLDQLRHAAPGRGAPVLQQAGPGRGDQVGVAAHHAQVQQAHRGRQVGPGDVPALGRGADRVVQPQLGVPDRVPEAVGQPGHLVRRQRPAVVQQHEIQVADRAGVAPGQAADGRERHARGRRATTPHACDHSSASHDSTRPPSARRRAVPASCSHVPERPASASRSARRSRPLRSVVRARPVRSRRCARGRRARRGPSTPCRPRSARSARSSR